MITAEQLGFSTDELRERIINQAVDKLLSSKLGDDEGNEYSTDTTLVRQIRAECQKRIDEAIVMLGEKKVLPLIYDMVDKAVMQNTNEWGEKKGEPIGFHEYLAKRAEAYITEKVNYEGKAKSEAGGYSWTGQTTRISFMINTKLNGAIEEFAKSSLKEANASIVDGIRIAVETKLKDIQNSIRLTVGK